MAKSISDALTSLEQSYATAKEFQVGHDILESGAPLARTYILLGRDADAERTLEELHQASGHDHGAEGHVEPAILLGQAELADARRADEEAAQLYADANFQANLSKQKEVAVESRVALGRLYLRQGKLPNSERLLRRTQNEARQARLKPLEAAAAAALSEVYLVRENPEAARQTALEAIELATEFEARPTLHIAQWSLARALAALNQNEGSIEAYREAASLLDWIRGSLSPEDVKSFVERDQVQAFVEDAEPVLSQAGDDTLNSLK